MDLFIKISAGKMLKHTYEATENHRRNSHSMLRVQCLETNNESWEGSALVNALSGMIYVGADGE